MSVITISRQYGSGGDEIAARICELTGYRLFDKTMLVKAATESGLSDHEVIDYSEENYKIKGFLNRLLAGDQPVAQVRVWRELLDGVRVMEALPLSEDCALELVQKAILAAYQVGDTVIIGRGGQMVLRDLGEVLNVRVEAGLEDRILRVRQSPIMAGRIFSDSVEARRAAQRLIEERDEASAAYLRRYYGVDWADPSLYHLRLNTSKLSFEQAATAVVALAERIEAVKLPPA